MFRPMRRKKQEMSIEKSIEVLQRGTSGVLAVLGDEDYPYTVPLSYVYQDGKLYFHCARAGHKLDAIMKNPKVSFCVIDQDCVVPEQYTTYFRSVVVFGTIRILEEELEIRKTIEQLAEKYAPQDEEGRKKEMEKGLPGLYMLELKMEHLSGKEAKELVNQEEN